jgi:hydrogenase maturation factor
MGRTVCGLDHKFGALKMVAPVSKFDYVLVHMGFIGSHKLSSFDSH